jgi:hypothetical protein
MNRRNPAAIARRDFYIRTIGAVVGAFFVIWAFSSCETIATYDAESYKQVTACKAEVLHLMTKANTSYDSHLAEIETVFLDVNKAYQYDYSRPLNTITVQMWNLLRDPNRDTYAGFLKMWKKRGTLPQGYIDQEQIVVGYAFDRIAQLESGKVHP